MGDREVKSCSLTWCFTIGAVCVSECVCEYVCVNESPPCSLLWVLLSGQWASTSSATQVRLFLPCKRKVQSSRERSTARLVSSPTPLLAGILGG